MKRKFNLWLNIVTICLCVCAIAVGVYSATTATLNASGKVAFKAHGCDVDITAYMYGHSDDGTADGYPVAEADPTHLYQTASPLEIRGETKTLDIGSRYFTDMASDTNQPEDIVVVLTVTNVSAFKITATFDTTNITTPTNVTVTPNPASVDIDVDDTATITLTIHLNANSDGSYTNITMPTESATNNLSVGIEFKKWQLLNWSNDMGWYINMGTYNGTKVAWVPIAESTDGGTTFTQFDGKTYTDSNEKCKPQAGNTYYFLSYNILPLEYGSDKSSSNRMSWGFYDYASGSSSSTYRKAWYWDESTSTTVFYQDSSNAYVNANDYSVSNIRDYLNGNTAYRYSTTPNYTPNTAQKLTSINDLYGLSTDAVFNGTDIQTRSISDLYINIQADSTASTATYTTLDVPTTTKGTGSDKLWLLSHEEYYKYVYTNTAVHNVSLTHASYQTLKSGVPLGGTSADTWWLRSPYSTANCAYFVYASGSVIYTDAYTSLGVRPAFQIFIN